MGKKKFFKKKTKLTLKKVNAKVAKIERSIEVKEFYKTLAETGLTGDVGIVVNGMQRGDANGQRDANKISCKNVKIQLRMELLSQTLDGTDTTQPTWELDATDNTRVRVMLVVNKQNNLSAGFLISEILRDAANQVTKQNSQYNYDFVSKEDRNKYRILYDKSFLFMPLQNGADRVIKINKSLRMNTIYSDSDLGTGADIINNKVELLIIPERLATMRFAFTSVLSYTDS